MKIEPLLSMWPVIRITAYQLNDKAKIYPKNINSFKFIKFINLFIEFINILVNLYCLQGCEFAGFPENRVARAYSKQNN